MLPVPLFVTLTNGVAVQFNTPWPAPMVMVTDSEPVVASISARVILFKINGVSSTVVNKPVAGKLTVGASLTAVILKSSILATGSVSTPPLAVPPLSCTLKPSAPMVVPFLFKVGANVSLPALISATVITWPVVIATPFSK